MIKLLLMLLLVSPLVAGDQATFLNGETYMREDSDGSIVVFIDRIGADGYSDGFVDDVYLLQRGGETAQKQPLDTVYFAENTHILVKRGSLSFTSVELDLTIDLYLLDLAAENRAVTNPEKEGNIQEFKGIGLVHYSYVAGALEMEKATSEQSLYVGCSPIGCTAGGPGSSSCTVGGCTKAPTNCDVTCNSGFYSCCGCTWWTYQLEHGGKLVGIAGLDSALSSWHEQPLSAGEGTWMNFP